MGYLEEAGFQDVKVVVKKVPINPWPKHPRKKVCTCLSALGQECAEIVMLTLSVGAREMGLSCLERRAEKLWASSVYEIPGYVD